LRAAGDICSSYMIKQLLKAIFRYIPVAITRNQKYDAQTRKVIRKVCRPDSNCIDVGCHKGEILDLMIKFAPNGKHMGFEPIPGLYNKLKEKYSGTSCTISDIALSNTTGVTTFNYVVSNPSYSGIKKRNYDRPGEQDTVIEVKTDKLDNIINPSHRADLIKIDVEGAEMLVLEGATGTIAKWKPVIIFEYGLGASDVYGTTPDQLFGFFGQLGYKISLLEHWLNKGPHFSQKEFEEQFYKRLNYYFIAYAE